nr:uncharacterized protein LOC124816378 [Hydra vulgaris]
METERLLKEQEKNFAKITSANMKIFTERLDKLELDLSTNKIKTSNIEKDVEEIKESLNFQEELTKQKIAEINKRTESEIKHLYEQKRFESIKETNAIKNISEKLVDLENRSRRNNLRIEGVNELPGETWNDCEKIVKDIFSKKLKIPNEIIIERAHRSGPKKVDFAKETIETRKRLWGEVLNLRKEDCILNEFSDPDTNYYCDLLSDCSYYYPSELAEFLLKDNVKASDKIKILHVNIRSLNRNFENLLNLLEETKNIFDILCLTETWITINDLKNSSNFNLPYFKLISQDSLIDKYKNNSKRTWEIIKEISGKQKDCSGFLPQVIKVDNRIIYEQKEIACEFNNFFVKIGPELANKIPKTQAIFSDFLVPMTDCITSGELSSKLSFEEFEIAFKTLKKNKATGADDINCNIILNCFEQLKDILFKVFSASINQGIFPEQLKIAKITPIFKEGDRAIISNYRPISILPIFSKILERIMYNRVYDYFQCNNLLYSNQFGFKKHNSTEHAIIQFVRKISKSFENSQYTLGIFIDLSKAFDTVDHTILLHKLKYYENILELSTFPQ